MTRDMRRVLVTGGAGFLGGYLCARLLDEGVEVCCVDNLSTSVSGAEGVLRDRPGYRFIRHDITAALPPTMSSAVFDTVFHLASPASPADYFRLPVQTLRVGSLGTAVVLDLAERHGARVVLASTSEVYGDPLEHPQRETYWGNVNPIGPRSVYDEAKRFAEALVFAYERTRSADIGVARIFNTYGPRMRVDDGRMVPTFCRQAVTGAPITVEGDGSQTRSLCYVGDTVGGLIALARSDSSGPVNIGNPHELTVMQTAELIRDLAGSSSPIVNVAAATDDPKRRCPDIDVAHREIGWQPEVSHRDGLATTVQWFQNVMGGHADGRPSAFDSAWLSTGARSA
ncbi:NAD-dependent epimerase/dehydratase family protein [Mycobacterium sp. NPDC003323]